jgi:hypothetical protein
MARCEHDLIRIRSSASGQTDNRRKGGESVMSGEEFEVDEEERDAGIPTMPFLRRTPRARPQAEKPPIMIGRPLQHAAAPQPRQGLSRSDDRLSTSHDAVHQRREGQTPYVYNTDTVALQAGARVDKVGASATLRSLGMDRQGALNTTCDLTRLIASQTRTLMTSRRLR